MNEESSTGAAGGRRPVVLLIADISGYTRFMVSHRKAQSHGQIIVSALLGALRGALEPAFEMCQLEGDAIFMFAVKDGPAPAGEWSRALGRAVVEAFRVFAQTLSDTGASVICKCEACAAIDRLRLKIIVHSGEGLVRQSRGEVAGARAVDGVDVIIAHRLLKNSVPSHEYLLCTEAALGDLAFDRDARDVGFVEGVEDYDEIGAIKTFVAEPASLTGDAGPCSPRPSLTHPTNYEILRCEIRREYAEVATDPQKGFHFHTGRRLARILGYAEADMDAAPAAALESFAGTGNPFAAGDIPPGSRVVDVGCGAGFDAITAARRAGPGGRVIAVDMTPEMIEKARAAVAASGLSNIEVREGFAEGLPVEDGWADVLISNGVLNLCPSKPVALKEMSRVLRPGGRLQIGDILVQKPVPPGALKNIDLWTG
jgi:2-polyprenyl-3-methyl-5-hydroxy-6-metoxy-1,4-benzoquinol methylase/class 3 adenylate cyclase